MELIKSGLEILRSSSSALFDRTSQRPAASSYLPLESRGDAFVSTTDEDLEPHSKKTGYTYISWVVLAVLASVVLFLAVWHAKSILVLDPAVYGSPAVYGDPSPQHPVSKLVQDAQLNFRSLSDRQSPSISEAVVEYKRRYGMPPPPHFDKWYDYARNNGVELIDEYDSIYDSLLLYWSLEPVEMRKRTTEALGYPQSLMGVSIRSGEVTTVGEGQGRVNDTWQASASKEMISKFSKWLPDMDLAFNTNDESRILIPHEDIERMRRTAEEHIKLVRPVTSEYSKHNDLNNGKSYAEVPETRFNRLDQQHTWTHSRMSCPVNSPARDLGDNLTDRKTGFIYENLEFVFNVTAFTDICLAPSVRQSIGLFNSPNVFSVSHDLVPIFSPSKLSSFQDILYPSMYYYADRAIFNDSLAVPWAEKDSKLYWRGATSGGFSWAGNWRVLLRQAVIGKLMYPEAAHLLESKGDAPDIERWTSKVVPGATIATRYDVMFVEIKQCGPVACDEMYKFFGNHSSVPQEDAWKHKYLLDMDGNALSGRFYALLKSASLPLKLAYFREWHMERIIPWVHYVPVSAKTSEYPEILRYFDEEEDGRQIAENLAKKGGEWSHKTLRKEDMEVYMFRLLLEYGRIVDDNRASLGFSV